MTLNPAQNKLNLAKKIIPNLVHSIRNPLSVLKLNHYFINLHRQKLPEEIAASLDDCSKAVLIMEKFLDKYSQLYTNTPENYCSLNDVVSTAADILELSARRRNLEFVKELQDELPSLYIDRTKLLDVILNLILNAIELDFTGKQLYIITSYNGHNIWLEIKGDNLNESSLIDYSGYSREVIEDLLGNDSNIISEFIQGSGIKISFNINKAEGNLLEIQNSDCR
jgi:signal transduction histidine kinase